MGYNNIDSNLTVRKIHQINAVQEAVENSRIEDPKLQPYLARFDQETMALLEDPNSSIEAIMECIKRSSRFNSHELAKLTQIFQAQERRIENFEKDRLLGVMQGRGFQNSLLRYGSMGISLAGAAAVGASALNFLPDPNGSFARGAELLKSPIDEVKNNRNKEFESNVRDSEGRKSEMRQSADRQLQTTDELGRSILQGEQGRHDTVASLVRTG